jgi:hypothetical protein
MKNLQNKRETTTNRFNWSFKNTPMFKAASIFIMVAVFVGGSAVMLFNKDKKAAQQIAPPEVLAAEMPGWWYKDYFGSSICEHENCKSESDPDNDKLNNSQEFFYNSSPVLADSNGNGKNDGEDVAGGFDPSKPGNITFEESVSDDSIFGESILFSEDIKTEYLKTLNPNTVNIPLVEDSELIVNPDHSNEAMLDYVSDMAKTVSKYFTQDKAEYVAAAVNSNDLERLEDVKLRAAQVSSDLKKVTVPPDFVKMHKYTIAFFDLLQIVIYVPSQDTITNLTDPFANRWYDSTQAFFLVSQNMNQELIRLKSVYNITSW